MMRIITILIIIVGILPITAAGQPPANSDLDEQLLEDLPAPADRERPAAPRLDGEDIGQAPQDPLAAAIQTIQERMKQSRARLAEGDTSADTSGLQREIADQLAELIEQLRKNQSSGASASRATQSPAQDQNENQNHNQNHNQNQAQSSETSDQTGESSPAGAANTASGRGVWGHLPERVREQIRSSAIEEFQFLPSFEELIEAYYQRLAQDPDEMPRQN